MSDVAVLDTVRQVATPEGCEIGVRLAGPVSRARAWLFDFILRLAIWLTVVMIARFAGDLGGGAVLLTGFLLEWFYPVLFEVYMGGQTPGKKIFGLVVLHDDGRPVRWGASFARNTLRFVDFLPAFYAAGFVAILLSRDGKRLGDLAAGTVVAYAEDAKGKGDVDGEGEMGSEPPPMPLTVEEQQAIIEYGRRARQLTPERAAELAMIPAPLSAGITPDAAQRRLLRIGNFLLGKR